MAAPILRIHKGDHILEEFELTKDRVTIGRGSSSDITLDSTAISRKHAEVIKRADGSWYICDLYSKTGTYVNGQAEMEHKLEIGDTITIDEFQLLFRY